MPDHFAVLGQPRRPWLDEEALKDAFHRASAQQHPDIAGGSGEKAAALNAAYAALREPAARLRHLLELEKPEALQTPPVISSEMGGAFGKIAALHRACLAFGKKNTLARALAMGEWVALRNEIDAVLAAFRDIEVTELAALRDLDARWEQGDPLAPTLLAAAQWGFAFRAKWQAQLREDLFQLGA